MPTSRPRHSITETPALHAVLERIRRRLGPEAPTLAELVARGAEVTLHELDAQERARTRSLGTFVERLRAEPDLEEVRATRHADRQPREV